MATFTTTNKKSIAKPDMTPLVDLGFLLITFFMYTTTFTKPVQMPFAQPKANEGSSFIKESNSLTLLISEYDKVYYHSKAAKDLTELKAVEESKNALRELLITSKTNAISPDMFTVIIKPSDLSTYNKFVDILDEMIIVNQEHYAVADLSQQEKTLLGL